MIDAGRRQYMTDVTSSLGAKDWMATAWAVRKEKKNRRTVNVTEINKPVLDRNSPRFCWTTNHSPLVSHHSYLSPLR